MNDLRDNPFVVAPNSAAGFLSSSEFLDAADFELLEAKQNTNLKIPKEIELIGFDDISMSNWKSYDLTTVRQPIRQMSKLVTQLIDEYIKDPDYEAINHIVQGRLITVSYTHLTLPTILLV